MRPMRLLRALIRRSELERELDEELRFHLEMQTAENLRLGMTADEARRQSVLLFGGVEGHREAARDARGVRLLEEIAADLRYGARGLARNPGFTLVAAATLALGIGANSAVFSIANGLLWTPPPGVGNPDGLSWATHVEARRWEIGVSYPDFVAFRDEGGVFGELAAFTSTTVPLAGDGDAEQVKAELATANYFSVLRMRPALGRGFAADEGEMGSGSAVVVLSHDLWSRRYGASPDVLGREITVGGSPFTVVGVAPEGFRGLSGVELPTALWVPVSMYREAIPLYRDTAAYDLLGTGYGARAFSAVGRLRPGVTREDAAARLAVLTRRAAAATPEAYDQVTTRVEPLRGVLGSGGGDAGLIFVWGGVTMIILLIACGNVANLLLARAAGRGREMAIRAAVGASRGRIVRQLLAESVLLALLGGIAGLLLGVWMVQLFLAFVPAPLALPVGLDARVVLVTGGASIVTGLVFGLSPALRASSVDLNVSLRDATHGGRGRTRPQRLLVGAQLALSFLLLVVAGLLVENIRAAISIDSVYAARDQVLTFAVDIRKQGYPEEVRARFKGELLERAAALPGVVSVSVAAQPPGTNGFCSRRLAIDGEWLPEGPFEECTRHGSVGAGYFATVGAPLVRGREFTAADGTGSQKVALVNETAARELWPEGEAIGGRVRIGADTLPEAIVIGVVPDALDGEPRGKKKPAVYWAEGDGMSPGIYGTIVLLRTQGDPERLVPSVRALVREMDPALPVLRVATLRQVLEGNRSEGVLAGRLLLVFGGVALALTLVGLHGLVAFAVAQRTREIGIRVALGASRRQVLALFGRDTLRLGAAGVGVGVLLASAAGKVLSSLLNGIEPADGLTVAAVAVLLLLAALLAAFIPARRATRVDAMVALRAE